MSASFADRAVRVLENATRPRCGYAGPHARRPNLDEEFADEAEEDDAAIEDENAHTLSIRRANGEEVVSIFSPDEGVGRLPTAGRRDDERIRRHTERPDCLGERD